MVPYNTLILGGIAIAGRSGSGKSTTLFGSKYVQRIIIADSGSLGHRQFALDKDKVFLVNPLNERQSPIRQCEDKVREAMEAKELYALDSFSTLQEQEVGWLKKHTQPKPGKSLDMLTIYNIVVGNLRDFALTLASIPGFTIFNTSPGGSVRTPGGQYEEIPQGCLTGFPALSGLAGGSESILARFTTVWPVFGGLERRDGDGNITRTIPRGFLLPPPHDLRPENVRRYCPVKDPLEVLTQTPVIGSDPVSDEPIHPFLPRGQCTIDAMIERMDLVVQTEIETNAQKAKKRK